MIDDACQSAWATLLSRQPHRGTFFSWLRVVAVREAYRLLAIERRDVHLEDLRHPQGWDAVITGRADLDDAVEARHALRLLAQLPEQQRADLARRIAGFSYREIAEMTEHRTPTSTSSSPRHAHGSDSPN